MYYENNDEAATEKWSANGQCMCLCGNKNVRVWFPSSYCILDCFNDELVTRIMDDKWESAFTLVHYDYVDLWCDSLRVNKILIMRLF